MLCCWLENVLIFLQMSIFDGRKAFSSRQFDTVGEGGPGMYWGRDLLHIFFKIDMLLSAYKKNLLSDSLHICFMISSLIMSIVHGLFT